MWIEGKKFKREVFKAYSFFLCMQKTRHINQLPLDMKSLMDGLSSLVLPSQKVQISPHMYECLLFVSLFAI